MITCGVLVPSAMRYHLWWLAGSNNSATGLSQLLRLLAVTAIAVFSIAYVYLSLWRMRWSRAREELPLGPWCRALPAAAVYGHPNLTARVRSLSLPSSAVISHHTGGWLALAPWFAAVNRA